MFDNPSKAKTIILGAACVLVAVGAAAAAWYTVPILKRHDSMLAQNAGVKQSVQALGGRIDQQNSKLAEWSKAQDQVRGEIADLRKEMRSRIESVRRQSGRSKAPTPGGSNERSSAIASSTSPSFSNFAARISSRETRR